MINLKPNLKNDGVTSWETSVLSDGWIDSEVLLDRTSAVMLDRCAPLDDAGDQIPICNGSYPQASFDDGSHRSQSRASASS